MADPTRPGSKIFDPGPITNLKYKEIISKCSALVWREKESMLNCLLVEWQPSIKERLGSEIQPIKDAREVAISDWRNVPYFVQNC